MVRGPYMLFGGRWFDYHRCLNPLALELQESNKIDWGSNERGARTGFSATLIRGVVRLGIASDEVDVVASCAMVVFFVRFSLSLSDRGAYVTLRCRVLRFWWRPREALSTKSERS